ncbi:MAG: 4-hydroxy-tetrahydrodipicolinate synthase [Bacteroidota bacterium]|nr:4-hydroxy-tetrahydrodipicolinate synthase [Bacteroidota bacterium]
MSANLKGTGVALVTPFTKDFKVDFDALGKLLEHTSNGGVDYFVIHGTTGESATTTDKEKSTILKFIKENNPKKLPLVYGLGGNNTQKLIEDLGNVDFSGIEAILSVSPSYNKPSQEGLFQHYSRFADHSPLPVILYNVPGRTSVNIAASTTLRLAQHPNIIGTKEASGSLDQAIEILKNKPNDFLFISGDDFITVPLISLGAVGLISVLANALPSLIKDLVHGAMGNNYALAQKATYDLVDINPLMYREGNPVGVKQLLKVIGICDAYVRLPLISATPTLQQEISEIFEKSDWAVKAG